MPLVAKSVAWNLPSLNLPSEGVIVETISPRGTQTPLRYKDGQWYDINYAYAMTWTPVFWKEI